jgi:Predicted membrane protein
LRFF